MAIALKGNGRKAATERPVEDIVNESLSYSLRNLKKLVEFGKTPKLLSEDNKVDIYNRFKDVIAEFGATFPAPPQS